MTIVYYVKDDLEKEFVKVLLRKYGNGKDPDHCIVRIQPNNRQKPY